MGIIFFINWGEPPNFSPGFFPVLKQMANYAHLIATDVEDTEQLPTEFLLSQNYPNPFNPTTKIKYSVPQSSNVVIKVFDILGKEIETLLSEEKSAGTYEVNWNAENFPSGVYFYQLQASSFIETKKMILLK